MTNTFTLAITDARTLVTATIHSQAMMLCSTTCTSIGTITTDTMIVIIFSTEAHTFTHRTHYTPTLTGVLGLLWVIAFRKRRVYYGAVNARLTF
jgi:hypothetical protein